jgi:hypothetical protein
VQDLMNQIRTKIQKWNELNWGELAREARCKIPNLKPRKRRFNRGFNYCTKNDYLTVWIVLAILFQLFHVNWVQNW